MARTSAAKAAGATAKASKASDGLSAPRLRPLARRRVRALIALAVVGLLAWGAQGVWRWAAPVVASRDRYLIPAESITVSTPPEWIVADVRGQVIHSAALDGRLSILDAELPETIGRAFALHPWVQSIDRIEKRYPPSVHIELTYRRPVAVVETVRGELLPVDAGGRRLPENDVLMVRRKSLPRIAGIVGQPPLGQPWEDARAQGAVEIVNSLTEVWERLYLDFVTPRARPELRGERQFFIYDIVTRGGTRIIWGASPLAAAPAEARVVDKVARLQRCIEQFGPLDSVTAPGIVDVRGELHVEPRMVKQPSEPSEAPTVVK